VTEIVADNVEFLEWGDKNISKNESSGGFESDGFQAIEDDDDIPSILPPTSYPNNAKTRLSLI